MTGDVHNLADSTIAPVDELVHSFHKEFRDNDFRYIRRFMAFDKLDAKQVEIARSDLVAVSHVEKLAVVTRKHDIVATKADEWQRVACLHAFNLLELHKCLSYNLFCTFIAIVKTHVIKVIRLVARVGIVHFTILQSHDDDHHDDEDVDEHLHAEQSDFPSARVLGIVAERHRDRDSHIKLGRDEDRHEQHEYQHQTDDEDASRDEQGLERHIQ